MQCVPPTPTRPRRGGRAHRRRWHLLRRSRPPCARHREGESRCCRGRRPNGSDAPAARHTHHRGDRGVRRCRRARARLAGAICAWRPRPRCSACSAAASACRSSTEVRCGCPASSDDRDHSTSSLPGGRWVRVKRMPSASSTVSCRRERRSAQPWRLRPSSPFSPKPACAAIGLRSTTPKGLPELDGLRVEFEHGRTPLADEARRGAARFVASEGRHGRFGG